MNHFHIRWSTKEVLDWQAFDSHTEATERAAQLVRPGETYKIEKRDESCPRCWRAFRLKTSHEPMDPDRTYPWQQSVIDAVEETHPQERMKKVNVAQLEIAKRIINPSDLNEQAAIKDAMRTLRALLPERKQPAILKKRA